MSASALLNLNIDFSEIDLMNIAAYKAIYQRFGLLATLHDFCISAIEKIVRFRLLLVYVHKDLGPINTPPIPGLDIRVMTAEELEDVARALQRKLAKLTALDVDVVDLPGSSSMVTAFAEGTSA